MIWVQLDKPRLLRYSWGTIADIEAKAGMSLRELVTSGGDRPTLSAMRILLWGGLKWNNKGLTVEGVGELLDTHIQDGGRIDVVGEQIIKALRLVKNEGGSPGKAVKKHGRKNKRKKR